MFGNKVGHLGRVGSLTLAQRVSAMFSRGEPGAWYDPSDLSTLFQDAAGTTPVTAVEQPVGRILDKSGRGNHATQSTTTKRPVLSRRVNALINTENPSAWPTTGITGTAEAGGVSLLQSTANGSQMAVGSQYPIGATPITNSCIYRSIEYLPGDALYVAYGPAAGGSFVTVRTSDGAVVGTAGGAVPLRKITTLADGWVRIETWDSLASHVASQLSNLIHFGNTFDGLYTATTGRAGTQLRVRKPQYVVLPFGSTHSVDYQRVNTATDYDADPIKFPAYRRLDGVDDSHASATGGGGTAGFFFSASVTPQGGAGTARTLFSDAGTNTGYIVRLNASNQLELAAGNGTAYTTVATSGTLAVGTTDVVQAWDDGANLNVKIGNGATASVARPTVSAGTAGYTMGQDNGASTGYFNGRVYSTIYRKDSGLTQVQREAVALYQRQKARMP